MAHSILVPMHVEAKVVSTPSSVAELDGAPFNQGSTLEPGIHVHWALPDALTRARFLDRDGGKETLFPAVPDLWLVVRFNPVTAGSTAGRRVKRTWRGWVVDSRAKSAVPFEEWSEPQSPDADNVHTFAGLLPSAASAGAPGWGLWNNSEQGSFNPALAAYYPAARGRFGFHDDLSDLPSSSGSVTYSVVGWYSQAAHDPLYSALDRSKQLKSWKFSWKTRSKFAPKTAHAVVSAAVAKDIYVPRSTRAGEAPDRRRSEAKRTVRKSSRASEVKRQSKRFEAMKASTDKLVASTGNDVAAVVGAIAQAATPREIVCHGAVLEVPLSPPAPEAVEFEHGDVRLFPTVKTAMAAVASLDQANKVEMTEALLQSLEGQQAKTQAGVLDIPAALHALTFQSTPGKSRFFARLEMVERTRHFFKVPDIGLTQTATGASTAFAIRKASGHWPKIAARSSAAVEQTPSIKDILKYHPKTVKPYEPTEQEVDEWIAKVNTALAEAADEAASKGTPIDPEVVRVRDSRNQAHSEAIGPMTNDRGSDGAGYWLDVNDRDAMRRTLIAAQGAVIGLPDADELHEVPGPRWYRPWSPHLVVSGQGRSYRFGEDGRFEASGVLRCRVSGETLSSIKNAAGKIVLARNLVSNTSAIGANPDVPPEARALVEETTLLDSGNAEEMAVQSSPGANASVLQAAAKSFADASHAVWLLRDESLTAQHQLQVVSQLKGRPPSPVAFLPWRDPWDPLFVDVNYAHPFSSLETDWSLDPDDDKPPSVEFQALSDEATAPPAGQVELFDSRSFLTSTIVHTLESALVTKFTVDKYGKPIPAGSPPQGVDGNTFKKMAVLSAPLTDFDQGVMDRGRRERAGALRLNKLDVVDAFGTRRSWDSQIPNPSSTGGDDTLPWWTELPPRLPFWSRLQFRLRSAENDGQDATFKDSPVAGFLIPDLYEHSLEVYDASGRALGQLRSDPPQRGSTQATTLNCWFEVHPWTAAELQMPAGADPLDAIANERLRALVAGVAAQGGVSVPAGQPDGVLFETGLTAMMRIIDTLRPAIDPKEKVKNRKVRLTGDPIAVMAAGVWLEATEQTAPAALKQDPPPPAQPPNVPNLQVRIGDQSRPDDGVFGCFLPDAQAAASRFAPVDVEASEKAILNELPFSGIQEKAATHPFVAGLESVFSLGLGDELDLTVLVEAGAGLHAVCGALPRKKIVVPREFLAAAEKLEPTFRVGPLLSVPALGALQPLLPVPQVEGHEVEWLRFEPGEGDEPGEWVAASVPPLPPVGAAPPARIEVSRGWMRLAPTSSSDK